MTTPTVPAAEKRAKIPYTSDQKYFIVEAMLGFAVSAVTGGVFLTSLMLMMGATDLVVGLLSSVGSWALMVSLPAAVLAERIRNRKALIMWVVLGFRGLSILPVFLPLVMGMGMPTVRLAAVLLVAGACISTVNTTVFPIYFMDSVPREGASPYIYTRGVFIRLANAVFSIAAGLLMDRLKSYDGLLILYCAGLAFMALDIYCLSRIKGPEGEHTKRMDFAEIRRKLFEPLRNLPYLRFLLFSLAYFFFFFAGTSYTSLYLYKYLGLGYLPITVFSTSILVLMVFLTRPWAAVEKRFGARRVLVATSVFLSLDFLVYGFLTPGTLWLLPVSVAVASVGNAGFWICILPYRYGLMPKEGKTIYEAWNGTFFAVAGLLGTLAGGRAHGLLGEGLATPFLDFGPYQLVFLAVGLCAAATALVFGLVSKGDGEAADHAEALPSPDPLIPEAGDAGSGIPSA
jgi:MFS family permease